MSEDSTQIYTMSAMLGWCARTFAGTRKTIASFKKPRTASWCRCDGVLFPFDARFMDRKRFVAIACGAIEEDEIAIAAKVIDSNDVIVEFGAGMGIAAARVNRLCTPKQHICFEAIRILVLTARHYLLQMNLILHMKLSGLAMARRCHSTCWMIIFSARLRNRKAEMTIRKYQSLPSR